MAVNTGYEVLVATADSADEKAEIAQRVLQVLGADTLSIAYATTYAAGTTSTNQASIAVDGASPNFGIRVIMDSAVVGTNAVARILKQLIQVLEANTLVLTHAAAYAAGDRTYNMTITVT